MNLPKTYPNNPSILREKISEIFDIKRSARILGVLYLEVKEQLSEVKGWLVVPLS